MIEKIFKKQSNQTLKHQNYYKIYDKIFNSFKGKEIIFVELGVLYGGSLQAWQEYFGENAKIIGIDINPNLKKFETKKIKIEIGDQSKKEFWEMFYKKYGKIDILLDDGSHINFHTIFTLISSIKNIKKNGMIVVEDTMCSYDEKYGNPSKYSFINFTKKCIDDLHSNFPKSKKFNFSISKYIKNINFYPGIVVFNASELDNTSFERSKYGKRDILIEDTMKPYFLDNKFYKIIKKIIPKVILKNLRKYYFYFKFALPLKHKKFFK